MEESTATIKKRGRDFLDGITITPRHALYSRPRPFLISFSNDSGLSGGSKRLMGTPSTQRNFPKFQAIGRFLRPRPLGAFCFKKTYSGSALAPLTSIYDDV